MDNSARRWPEGPEKGAKRAKNAPLRGEKAAVRIDSVAKQCRCGFLRNRAPVRTLAGRLCRGSLARGLERQSCGALMPKASIRFRQRQAELE
jgi:hypothetical protein